MYIIIYGSVNILVDGKDSLGYPERSYVNNLYDG